MLATILFILFSATAIIGAVLMITRRNPLFSALFLVITFLSIAAIYFMLNAQFIAILQIIVYAGAIMVLFIFVIMLLDLSHLPGMSFRIIFTKLIGVLLICILLWMVTTFMIDKLPEVEEGLKLDLMSLPDFMPGTDAPNTIGENNMKTFSWQLFTDWIYPFEIVSIILLVGVVGSVLLSRREVK